ncbi:uncharacterized protein KRP23_1237 [Phytophthora ramorum]|uniref:uncharacterized protein n=1 Tax=Phytophthora ramorum TaxID=164328 RepID=UPI0030B15D6E|nr:hypothetical protein KRP23_1237 [Phytophthora ramorum]
MARGLSPATIVPTASNDNEEEIPPQASTAYSSEGGGTRGPDSTVAELQSAMYLQAAFNGHTSDAHPNVSDPNFTETSPPSFATYGSTSPQHQSTAIVDQQKPVAPVIGKPLRQRSQSAVIQKKDGVELTKNYLELVKDFRQLRPFTRRPDGKYPADTRCVYCVNARPTSVFFPCQHMCVCNDCIEVNSISTNYTSATDWCACPVCMTDIRLILPHSGKEEDKYWKWVLKIKPSLPSHFKQEFKEIGRRLSKDAAPTRGRRRSIVKIFRRESTPLEEVPNNPETPKNPPPKQNVSVLGRRHSWQPGEVADVQNVAASNEQEEAHNCSIL